MNTVSNSAPFSTSSSDGLRAGVIGPFSGSLDSKLSPGQIAETEVLLGVNTWEHVWLRDWGFGGKRAFLEQWWESVDWDTVERNAQFGSPGRGRG